MTWGVEADVLERFAGAGVSADQVSFERDTYGSTFPVPPSQYLAEFRDLLRADDERLLGGRANGEEAELRRRAGGALQRAQHERRGDVDPGDVPSRHGLALVASPTRSRRRGRRRGRRRNQGRAGACNRRPRLPARGAASPGVRARFSGRRARPGRGRRPRGVTTTSPPHSAGSTSRTVWVSSHWWPKGSSTTQERSPYSKVSGSCTVRAPASRARATARRRRRRELDLVRDDAAARRDLVGARPRRRLRRPCRTPAANGACADAHLLFEAEGRLQPLDGRPDVRIDQHGLTVAGGAEQFVNMRPEISQDHEKEGR